MKFIVENGPFSDGGKKNIVMTLLEAICKFRETQGTTK